MASLFKVKALYDFEAKEEDDLGFPAGQIIDVTEVVDDNWLEGKYNDVTGASKSGIFPREFVDKYEPEVPVRPSRPSRPKQDSTAPAPAPTPAAVPPPAEPELEEPEVPVMSKPQPPPVEIPPAASREEEASPPSATNPKSPPPDPKPAPAEPAAPASATAKKPPPVAAKSNAFRDRIAAFNQPAAAPIAPMVPGQKAQGHTFIKKPFVAPPPMSNSYVPPPKQEPVQKPYIREEDPEIRRRLEEDRAAAESAGLTGEGQQDEDEDAPKPTSLKERIARLQQQQMEQAQRRAEGGTKEKKKPPPKKPSESSEQGVDVEGEGEELQRQRSADAERQSLDVSREKPRVPSASRRPVEPMSPLPTAPEHELVSDGNEADHSAAGETTEDDAGTIGPEDSDDTQAPAPPRRASTAPRKEPDVGDEEDTPEDAEDDEEDSMDEETRRRMELRERMAKMSGGMGMAGMFGPPGGMPMPGGPPPPKKRPTKERKASEDAETATSTSPSQPAQRIPMIPVPGLNRVQSPESDRTQMADESQSAVGESVERDEDVTPMPPSRKSTHEERSAPPPVPKDSRPSGAPPVPGAAQPAPRPPPPESRPAPPPPPAGPLSPGPGSESDDEASIRPPKSSADGSGADTPGPLPIRVASGAAPPVPASGSIQSPENRRSSYFGSEPVSATSDKRASRPPPPVPGSPLTSPRPPPPPPPTAIPSRKATTHEDDEEQGESDYEGDYDTDIASSAKHKDALKAHVREPSLDDSTTADEAPMSPPQPPPHATAPRAVPPPPPSSQPPMSRPSMDAPRAPPPIPPTASPQMSHEDDYDPYRYDSSAQRGPPPPVPGGVPIAGPPIPPREPEQRQESSADDMYSTTPPRKSADILQRPVPAPPTEPPPPRAPPRQSLDVQRSNTTARRSMDAPRPSGEYNGQIAQDVNLSEDTAWWTAPRPLPPVLQSRNGIDLLSECEESTTSKRGGRTTVSKDIYVLYIDYSQTIINAQYDSSNPAEVSLQQRHLPPPPKLRQDQLETYWQRFGQKISEQVNAMGHSKKDTIVGDGSPTSLVMELIKAQSAALQPVGTRAYGSLVYANLANASTMQFDEIRPGDIVTLRNARFEGSHGAMKHKYKVDYGTSHVAIVEEWDGTKRAIRGWEQGREKKDKGVRSEKFRLGDLRSGEVKVWRVVGRDWVEWES